MTPQLGVFLRFFVLVVSLLVFGCDSLTFSKQPAQEEYKYAGLQKIQQVAPGRYRLEWPKANVNGEAVYEIFSTEQSGPKATTDQKVVFDKPTAEVKESGWVSPVLTFQNSTCFAVRVKVNGASDSNTNVRCTGHKKYQFEGAQGLSAREGGKFAVTWAEVPDEDVAYSLYARVKPASFDFESKPLATLNTTFVETPRFALNDSVCFAVRFVSKNFKNDKNSKEICSSDDGIDDFLGIHSAVSIYSGLVTVSWVKSANPRVKGYRIYQGNSLEKLVQGVEASLSQMTIGGLIPGERVEFAVRMVDATGREDDNTKTISIVVSDQQVLQGTFPGCVAATSLDTKRISVGVAFPAGASAMRIYRDGVIAGSVTDGTTTLIDQGLSEGVEYTYTCEAILNGLPSRGTAQLKASTQNVNPPNFASLKSLVLPPTVANGTVKLQWDSLGDGPAAKEFRIFMLPGTSAPNPSTATPVLTVGGGSREATVTGLGDELRYTFLVQACSVSNVCTSGSGQTVSLTSAPLPNTGAPQTAGATSARMENGQVILTAPWDFSKGAVAKRRISLRSGSFPFYNYSSVRDEVVSNLYAVPQELSVTGVESSQTLTYVVFDEDPSGNITQSTAAVTISTGDVERPSFLGLVSFVRGASNPETQLTVNFTAGTPESINPAGTTSYLVYLTESDSTTPTDPCLATVPRTQVAAAPYTLNSLVSLTLSDLTPRRRYRVCVKARDLASNLSATTQSLQATTGDRTAPAFGGLQTLQLNPTTSKLEARWNRATSATSDVRNYQVRLWRCSDDMSLTGGVCRGTAGANEFTQFVADSGSGTAGVDLDFSILNPPLTSGDRISVVAEACDNASTGDFASADNCTSTNTARHLALPDVDPPSGFGPLLSATVPNPPAEGVATLTWGTPVSSSDWADYKGFRIYTVEGSTVTFVKDCLCPNQTCAAQFMTTCDVAGLDVKRTYNFLVRAFDAAPGGGNLTAMPSSPAAAALSMTTLDQTPPTFLPNLNAIFVNTGVTSTSGVQMDWSAATDNQSSAEAGNTITYKIFRKVGSTFTTASATPAPGWSEGTLLATLTNRTYTNQTSNLSAASSEFYLVCAVDSSGNTRCDPGNIRQVAIPRLAPPVFAGIQSLARGTLADTTALVGFTEVVSETADPATGASDYPVYLTQAVPPATPSDACADPTAILKAIHIDNTPSTLANVSLLLSGLTPRRTHSVCVKARDRVGNLSATTSQTLVTTWDLTPPSFNGLQNSVYNGSTNQIDLTWAASTSADVKSYQIKVWKMIAGVAQTPSVIVRTATGVGASPTGTALAKSDFNFGSNDILRIVVQACDDASPNFNTSDNCTTFADSTARELNLPDVDPPTGFSGITNVTDSPSNSSRTTGAFVVNWASLGSNNSDWADIRGFRIYNVTNPSSTPPAMTLLKDCACAAYGCTEKLTSCEVTVPDAGRTYSLYVRAYDNAPAGGNLSLIALPNPIENVRSFRSADLVAPTFTSNFAAAWTVAPNRIELTWNFANDNQYAADASNTIGYRLYRKVDSTFSAATRAAFEAEGTSLTLSPDTGTPREVDTVVVGKKHSDVASGLVDGKTYYYAICAFDREPKLANGNAGTGNTTCDTAIRSATVPDITAPQVSNFGAVNNSDIAVTAVSRAAPTYKLKWNLSDNITSNAQIFVKVWRKVAATNTDFPAGCGYHLM